MMWGNLFLTALPFIPASMLVLFLFVLIHVLYRALFVPPGFDDTKGGHCAACGYVLGSLSDNRCPECGVDLLKAGVLTRRMFIQLRGSSVGAISAWTVMVFSAGGVAIAIWGSVVQTSYWMNNAMTGMGGSYTQIVTYGPQTEWDDETRELTGDTFEVRFELPSDSMSQALIDPLRVVLELPSGDEYTMEIEERGAWTLGGPGGDRVGEGEALNAETIDRLFEAGGFDTSDEAYRSYSGQIFVLADVAKSGGVSAIQSEGHTKLMTVQATGDYAYALAQNGWSTGGTAGTGFGIPGGIPYTLWGPVLYGFIGLVVVYFVGLVMILRRRRKILAVGQYTEVRGAA